MVSAHGLEMASSQPHGINQNNTVKGIVEDTFESVDAVRSDDSVGSFVIAALFPFNGHFIFIMFLPTLVYIVQWILIATLFTYYTKSYHAGACPGTGSDEEKALMFAIAALIFVKSTMRAVLLVEKMQHSGEKLKFSWLCPYSALDWFSELIFGSAALLLNLFVVFVADGPQDMVLNSVALEFIGELDNEIKENIFSSEILDALGKLNENALIPPCSAASVFFKNSFVDENGSETLVFGLMAAVVLFFTVIVVPGASLVLIVYEPNCKP